MAKAIINKARRLLNSITDLDDTEREEYHETLDEAEEASDDGQDITRGMERLNRRLQAAKEKADAKKKDDKGQPKPPTKKDDAKPSDDSSDNGKTASHGASKSWFGG